MSFPRVIHSTVEAFHVDQVGLSEALAFTFNQPGFVFQFIQKLNGFFIAAVQVLLYLCHRKNDIDAILVIPPAILIRELCAVKQKTIQQLCLDRDSMKSLILK